MQIQASRTRGKHRRAHLRLVELGASEREQRLQPRLHHLERGVHAVDKLRRHGHLLHHRVRGDLTARLSGQSGRQVLELLLIVLGEGQSQHLPPPLQLRDAQSQCRVLVIRQEVAQCGLHAADGLLHASQLCSRPLWVGCPLDARRRMLKARNTLLDFCSAKRVLFPGSCRRRRVLIS